MKVKVVKLRKGSVGFFAWQAWSLLEQLLNKSNIYYFQEQNLCDLEWRPRSMNTGCILVTEAVTVPNEIVIALLFSEIWLATERQTDRQPDTHLQGLSFMCPRYPTSKGYSKRVGKGQAQSEKDKCKPLIKIVSACIILCVREHVRVHAVCLHCVVACVVAWCMPRYTNVYRQKVFRVTLLEAVSLKESMQPVVIVLLHSASAPNTIGTWNR